ncbi:MAG: hypothetical protein PHE09_08600 [Oscillospiraceae bacterium]|nr:hypothetical protein [Oscillospiraceae bacterium]
MFQLIFAALCVMDGIFVGGFIYILVVKLFGNNSISRLLNIIIAIPVGIGYALFALNIAFVSDASMAAGAWIIFTPSAIMLLLVIANYIKNGNQNTK